VGCLSVRLFMLSCWPIQGPANPLWIGFWMIHLSKDIWTVAGEAFAAYAERRRKDKAGQPKRLLVDFVVGAHAQAVANRLLTLDAERYRSAFSKLRLVIDETSF
jgi:predicted nucleic acid-binding protein